MLNVLIVDDEESIRHMLSLMLKKAGYHVTAVANGEEALKELLVRSWDLLLCDLRMPQMDGMALLQEIKQRKLHVCPIMMSAYGDVDTALEAIKQGAYDYIAKPFKKDEVLLTLQKAEERERLKRENRSLREAQEQQFQFERIIARSEIMHRLFDVVRKVAPYRTTVLITGESGTGKELIARALHQLSPRRDASWVPLNCGAIPENLLESELFGHVKGAFTDATRDKVGLFQQADGGTIFLDEIAELPAGLQVKLLRVLQEGELRRVGDTKGIKIDVRVVAATLQDLGELVREGRFREDLYYRLHVLPLELPPLRERREDIPLLLQHFVRRMSERLGVPEAEVEPEALRRLMAYSWPGNIRELENAVEMMMVLCGGEAIRLEHLPRRFREEPPDLEGLLAVEELSIKRATRELERVLIRRALEQTGGNRTQASRLLEISHRALLYKLKEYELQDL